tara:strand:- start:243 stop:665 length:423 start_codon:yes stop_codon:yes gene_type:complete
MKYEQDCKRSGHYWKTTSYLKRTLKNLQTIYRMKQKKENQRRGRRNRQRGAELQRQAVRIAKDHNLIAFNRDRGGAQHEKGDIEIEDKFYGCKRRKVIAKWLKPEKDESGVVIREDRGEPYIVVPYEQYCLLLALIKDTI